MVAQTLAYKDRAISCRPRGPCASCRYEGQCPTCAGQYYTATYFCFACTQPRTFAEFSIITHVQYMYPLGTALSLQYTKNKLTCLHRQLLQDVHQKRIHLMSFTTKLCHSMDVHVIIGRQCHTSSSFSTMAN